MTTTNLITPIVQQITIDAPASAIFAALTDPQQLPQWWGEDGMYHVTTMESDLRVGGRWKSSGTGSDGKPFAVHGIYRVIDAPRVLEYTWNYDWDDANAETVVHYELEERDGATHLRVTHTGFVTVESRDGHDNGWVRVLGWLKAYTER